MKKKIDIRQLSIENLTDEIIKLGEKPYRAQQIHDWLWKKRAITFDQMTNLSKSFRKLIENNFNENDISLEYQNYMHPKYNQNNEAFISHLSIIDLFFNEGPKSKNYI